MDTPTYEPEPEPDRTPQTRTHIEAPTHEECQEDYAAAARHRAVMDKQSRRHR
ncbi:hypothetical protein [Streptomyces zaomyceticus]|uniref:hypothetical protein n=1 Tax=Streptomyces zaomyceticus TaxID=68286 RepID=UPI002E1157FC|nr:hypothetical protein OG237_15795 [Streptomyces zaomyceticus]